MRAGRATIEALVPHAGAMCLWDEAIEWNATRIVVRTQGHRLRAVDLRCARIDDLPGPLECEAEALIAGEDAQQYRFLIRHDGVVLAEGRAAVMLQPEAMR